METSEVLLFDGLPQRGGAKSMAGKRSCIRKKRVWSDVLGRNVLRCAEFSGGGLGQLGPIPFDLDMLKDVGVTAAVAVGGAVVGRKAGDWLGNAFKMNPMTPEGYRSNWYRLMEVGVGVFAGFSVAKFLDQPEIGMGMMIGPMVLNGVELAGQFLAQPGGAPVAGYDYGDPALGVVIEKDKFPAGWAQPSPFVEQAEAQFPNWAMP